MQTGLRKNGPCDAIVLAMVGVSAIWATLTPHARATNIGAAVINQLTILGVTPPGLHVGNYPGVSGEFDFTQWSIRVNQNLVSNGGDISLKVSELGDTITHEARHCEQWFRMARLLAERQRAKGALVNDVYIANLLSIPALAAGQAALCPAMTPQEKTEAEEWYESVYGNKGNHREFVYGLPTLSPVTTRVGGTDNHDIGAMVQETQFVAYQRNLAEEEDAHQTGLRIQTKYLNGLAPPRVPQGLAFNAHRKVRDGVSVF